MPSFGQIAGYNGSFVTMVAGGTRGGSSRKQIKETCCNCCRAERLTFLFTVIECRNAGNRPNYQENFDDDFFSILSHLSSNYMDTFIDIVFPKNGSVQDLSRILVNLKYHPIGASWLMNRKEGEYRIKPITITVFDKWADSHPQFPYSLQLANQTLVVTVMLPPHDRTAGIIAQHISRTVDRMCPLNDAIFWSGTGCINPFSIF